MKKIFTTAVLLLIVGITVKAFSEEPVTIGLQKQLLVDDYVIAEKDNITRKLGHPKKYGVVMKPTLPTDFDPEGSIPDGLPEEGGYYEFGRRLSVVWNYKNQIFQMLYRASGEGLTAYAESRDGVEWTKPLISDEGRSNLISYRGKTRGTFYEAAFMIDPTLPWGHPEKYKAAYNPGNTMCAIAHSADGIQWVGYNDGESVTGRAADTFNQILWDPIAKSYVLITRTDLGDEGGLQESRSSRIMVHDRENDLNQYPTAWRTILNINVDDPEKKLTINGVPELQMESMNIWIYENIYFGLMHVLTAGEITGSEGRISVPDPDKRPDSDVIDFYIGTSRNCLDFDKSWIYARKPFVERGSDGEFDKAMLQPSSEIITLGDEHYIFYTGQYAQHHAPKAAQKKSGKIGLAKLRLDRFIGQQAGVELGTITTKPFILKGNTLATNVDASAGWVQIEFLDEMGKGITGFSGKAAKKYKGVDELRLMPLWENEGNLSELKEKKVKLRITLQNATLYAFEFKE
jgi:hypothetical protein